MSYKKVMFTFRGNTKAQILRAMGGVRRETGQRPRDNILSRRSGSAPAGATEPSVTTITHSFPLLRSAQDVELCDASQSDEELQQRRARARRDEQEDILAEEVMRSLRHELPTSSSTSMAASAMDHQSIQEEVLPPWETELCGLVIRRTAGQVLQPAWEHALVADNPVYSEAHELLARLLYFYQHKESPPEGLVLSRDDVAQLYEDQALLLPRSREDEGHHVCVQEVCGVGDCTAGKSVFNCRRCGCNPHKFPPDVWYRSILDGEYHRTTGCVRACMYTGQLHICMRHTCERLVQVNGELVCRLTGFHHGRHQCSLDQGCDALMYDHETQTYVCGLTGAERGSPLVNAATTIDHDDHRHLVTELATLHSMTRECGFDVSITGGAIPPVRRPHEPLQDAPAEQSVTSKYDAQRLASVVAAYDHPDTRLGDYLHSARAANAPASPEHLREEMAARARRESQALRCQKKKARRGGGGGVSPAGGGLTPQLHRLAAVSLHSPAHSLQPAAAVSRPLGPAGGGGGMVVKDADLRAVVTRVCDEFLVAEEEFGPRITHCMRQRVAKLRERMVQHFQQLRRPGGVQSAIAQCTHGVAGVYAKARIEEPLLGPMLALLTLESSCVVYRRMQQSVKRLLFGVLLALSPIVIHFHAAPGGGASTPGALRDLLMGAAKYALRCLFLLGRFERRERLNLSPYDQSVTTLPDATTQLATMFEVAGFARSRSSPCHDVLRAHGQAGAERVFVVDPKYKE